MTTDSFDVWMFARFACSKDDSDTISIKETT